MQQNIPELSELVKYDGKNQIRSVNWEKFYRIYKLSKGNEKASRWLGYYIFALSNKEIIEQLTADTYVISTNSSKERMLNLEHGGIEYGFCREEDAEEFAQEAYNQKYPDAIIGKYEDMSSKNHHEDYFLE